MILILKECQNKMEEEERKIYETKTATDFFRYIYNEEKFHNIIDKIEPNKKITDEEWKYLFEKLYLVTYKSIQEEATPKCLDGIMYIISKVASSILPKDTKDYNEYYKSFEMLRSMYRTRQVNDDLLTNLTQLMQTKDEEELELLLKQHKEASLLRNNRDYMYRESLKSSDGVITSGERSAINCFNRSYDRVKEYRIKYQSMY